MEQILAPWIRGAGRKLPSTKIGTDHRTTRNGKRMIHLKDRGAVAASEVERTTIHITVDVPSARVLGDALDGMVLLRVPRGKPLLL